MSEQCTHQELVCIHRTEITVDPDLIGGEPIETISEYMWCVSCSKISVMPTTWHYDFKTTIHVGRISKNPRFHANIKSVKVEPVVT